jgi:radical SAM superfamily enzyme YgiQ (UPF0313 family)
MKIVLVRPPFMDPRAGAPIGLAYLSRVLKDEGHDVAIYDININIKRNTSSLMDDYNRDFVLPDDHPSVEYAYNKIEDYCDAILAREPDIVGFHLSYPTVDFGNEMARRISRHVKCIAGGPHTTYHQQRLLNPGYYDAIVVGYGEEGVLKAVKQNGIIREPLNRHKEYFPDYSDCSIEDYCGALPIVTTRGCPNQCNFCTSNYPYFFHSIESVLKQFKEIPNIRRVTYNDPNINVNARRTEELFTRLAQLPQKPFGHIFGLQIKEGYERYIPQMAGSGVREARLGVESGSIRERKSMNKVEFSNSLVVDFVKHLTTHKILAVVQLIFCYPDQTENDRQETLQLMNRINNACDTNFVKYNWFKFVVHYGTEELFKKKYGVITTSPRNWENSLYSNKKIEEIKEKYSGLIPQNATIYL